MTEPWERQQGESAKAFAKFAIYRDMGPGRSLEKVGKASGVSAARMEQLSVRHHWVARAEAWDDEGDRIKRAAHTREIAEMSERHARMAVSVLNKVVSRLIGDKANNVLPIDPASLNARDLATLLDIGVKVERLSRGEHSDSLVVATKPGNLADLSLLSQEELKDLESLVHKATAQP